MKLLWQALWFLLLPGLANMAPVFAARIFPAWGAPLDFGMKWRGRDLLGAHKTFRGLASGSLAGCLVFLLQQWLFRSQPLIQDISLFDYAAMGPAFGAWLGFSALAGDALKSFFKRRFDIKPGHPWPPFDQLDWVAGALLGGLAAFKPSMALVLACLGLGLALHLLVKAAGYLLKIDKEFF